MASLHATLARATYRLACQTQDARYRLERAIMEMIAGLSPGDTNRLPTAARVRWRCIERAILSAGGDKPIRRWIETLDERYLARVTQDVLAICGQALGLAPAS